MEATTLVGVGPRLPARQGCPTSVAPAVRKGGLVRARGGSNGRDYGGRLVDENMVVLRMRMRDLELSTEPRRAPPPEWMEWEKKYYAHYNEDVCEAVGLLQSALMNSRPSVAFGLAALLALSVTASTSSLLLFIVETAKAVVSGFHLI